MLTKIFGSQVDVIQMIKNTPRLKCINHFVSRHLPIRHSTKLRGIQDSHSQKTHQVLHTKAIIGIRVNKKTFFTNLA